MKYYFLFSDDILKSGRISREVDTNFVTIFTKKYSMTLTYSADVIWVENYGIVTYVKNRWKYSAEAVPEYEITNIAKLSSGQCNNWYHFEISSDEVDYWLKNNTTGKYIQLYNHVWLESENDATWWRLKWS